MEKITYASGTFRQKYSLGCAQFERNLCCVLTKFSIYQDSLTGVTPQYKNWSHSLFAEYLSVISVKLGQFPQEMKTAIIKICMEINFYFDTEKALRSSDLLVSEFVTWLRRVILWIPHVLKWWQMGKAGAPQAVPGHSCRVCWAGQYKQCLSLGWVQTPLRKSEHWILKQVWFLSEEFSNTEVSNSKNPKTLKCSLLFGLLSPPLWYHLFLFIFIFPLVCWPC